MDLSTFYAQSSIEQNYQHFFFEKKKMDIFKQIIWATKKMA